MVCPCLVYLCLLLHLCPSTTNPTNRVKSFLIIRIQIYLEILNYHSYGNLLKKHKGMEVLEPRCVTSAMTQLARRLRNGVCDLAHVAFYQILSVVLMTTCEVCRKQAAVYLPRAK